MNNTQIHGLIKKKPKVAINIYRLPVILVRCLSTYKILTI